MAGDTIELTAPNPAADACTDAAARAATLRSLGLRAMEPGRALELYARLLAARSLQAAANALVGALVEGWDVSRASIAWDDGGRISLLARSDPGPAWMPAEATSCLLGAMEEAIEQSLSLAWPPADGAGRTPADPICLEHQLLHRLTGNTVATVPLGRAGARFGALCVERDASRPFSTAELIGFEQLLALAAPALRWMQRGDERWLRRLQRDLVLVWSRLRQPDQTATRRYWMAGVLGVLFLALVPLQREVGGRARVEGAEQRVLVAPADGFVKTAHVRPGDRVKAGDMLVDLLDGDLRLERERWASQYAQHENAYAAAMAKADRATASTSLARIAEAQSQLSLVDEQMARGRVAAPFDGLVIQGDLSQSIGAPVHQGDTLLTLATTGRHRVIVEVDEVDIERVRPGQAGQLALSSLPWERQDIVVERIVPLAKAVDGRNVFEVAARLVGERADIRPGLLGRAEIVVGRLPPLWAWLGHALDRVRVAWWAWLG